MPKRPPRDRVLTTAMALFAAGLAALAAVFVLFTTGHRNLPAWLSASSVLMPLGFAIGAVHTVRQWRRCPSGVAEDEPAGDEPAGREPAGAEEATDRTTADGKT